MSPHPARIKALVFVVLTAVLTAFVSWEPLQAIGGRMWAPGIAAIAVQLVFERRLAGLGWRLPSPRWWLASVAFPLLYVVLAYVVAWSGGVATLRPDALAWVREVLEVMIGFPPLPAWTLLSAFALALCTLGMAMNLVAAFGEEIGWRGLLQPALEQALGLRVAVLLTGLIWSVWHWHLILGNDYHAGADPFYSVAMFTLMIVGMSWLTWRTRSLWPAVVVHAAHNLFIQGAFEPLTVRPEAGQWITGEWGVALPLSIALVIAVAVLLRRRPVPATA